MITRTILCAMLACAALPTLADARGGSTHTTVRVTITRGGAPGVFGRSTPAADAYGRIINTKPIANQGVAPLLQSILDSSASSESRYRAEMCRVVGSHADQLSCFNHK